MKTKIFHILIAVLVASTSFAQNKKKADFLYKNRAYVEAAELYAKLPKTSDVLKNLGDCYYFNSDIYSANKVYKTLYTEFNKDSLPKEFYFNYVDVLRGTKNYKAADEIATKYLGDSIDTEKLREKLEKVVPYTYQLERLTLHTRNINFGVGLYGDKIVFASTRNQENPKYKWNQKPYLDLYHAKVIDNRSRRLDSITPFPESINSPNQHESNAIFTDNGKTMYFSRNNKKRFSVDNESVATVKIFKAEFIDSTWTNIEPVSFASDTYSTMHPALNADGTKLFFASDMPGSLGSFDIYYVDVLGDGEFGDPINLGSQINTEHREQFPFLSKDNTLYFASNGYHGFGGLDVYLSTYRDGNYLVPLNLGETLNSEKDDFAFVVVDSSQTGYISSNKQGADNIYTFKREATERAYVVEGFVIDKGTKELLPETKVTLFDEFDNVIGEMVVGEDAKYQFNTQPNKTYKIEGYRPFYVPSLKSFDTNDSGNIEFNIELEIESYNDAEDIVVTRDDGYTYIELENIYFDFGKWDIKPEAAKTLDVLVDLLRKYPRMEIQLGAHTDSRSSSEFNLNLSENRAKATLEYMVANGISRSRLRSKGYGETRPLVNCGDDCTEEEFSINRRCEFLILK